MSLFILIDILIVILFVFLYQMKKRYWLQVKHIICRWFPEENYMERGMLINKYSI